MDPLTQFWETAGGWGYSFSHHQQEQFQQYLTLLLQWNARINLTAVRTAAGIGQRHFLDALCILPYLPPQPFCLIDVGSGAGFPGVPLKIMRPDMTLVLVESVRKKGQFLTALVTRLGLEGVELIVDRAETIGRDPRHRERYDVVAARAVAELRVLAEYLLPLCALKGRVLAPKGQAAVAETTAAAEAIRLLGGAQPVLHPLPPIDEAESGYLVEILKIEQTPAKYPRRVGIPAKRPL